MRRHICWIALLLLATAMILPVVGDEASGFSLEKVGEGAWAAIATDSGLAGANAGFVVGEDGVAVVDTFESPKAARQLLAEIRKITPLPIRFVVNTHYHLDHVNGNDVFAEAGATIVGHRNLRAWIRSENLKFLEGTPKPEEKARIASLPLPAVVYNRGVDLFLGSRRLEVRFFPGHTGGDSVVYVPDANLVFCGDLLWKDHFPNLIDANTGQWIETLDQFQSTYGSATYVPGHGGVAKSSDVVALKQFFSVLRAAIQHEISQGKTGDELVNPVLAELRSQFGAWAWFDDFAREDIEQTAQELSRTKKVPVPVAPGQNLQ
jgi:glyoxylase-like metal-dependent hydrolase (beta-lactamase superfamily II)